MITWQAEQHGVPVRVLGVGHCGLNLLDRLILEAGDGLEAAAMDSESALLNACVAPTKFLLGSRLVRGMGCGGDAALGLQILRESMEAIGSSLEGAKALLLLGGLGGGTASVMLPAIGAEAARRGIPVIALVTLPFEFEGSRKEKQAADALLALRQQGCIVAAFPLGRLSGLCPASAPLSEAFSAVEKALADAAMALLRAARGGGPLRSNFLEICGWLRPGACNEGLFCAHSIVRGPTRSHDAPGRALKNPLASAGLPAAKVRRLFVHASAGSDFSVAEFGTLMESVRRAFADDLLMHCGVSLDHPVAEELSLLLLGVAEMPCDNPPPCWAGTFSNDATSAALADVTSGHGIPEPLGNGYATSEEIVAPAIAEFPLNQPNGHAPEQALASDGQSQEPDPAAEDLPADYGDGHRASQAHCAERASGRNGETEEDRAESPENCPAPEASTDISQSLAARAVSSPQYQELFPELEASLPPQPAPPSRREEKKPSPKLRQEMLPLGRPQRGRFENSEPTIEEGEDLDIPTFRRRGIPI